MRKYVCVEYIMKLFFLQLIIIHKKKCIKTFRNAGKRII